MKFLNPFEILRLFILLFIRTYQYSLSPILGPRCRFYPSCSTYAYECFQVFPFYLALWYAGKRLIKCHPLNSGGFDPIPRYEGSRKTFKSCCNDNHEELY